MLNSRLLQLIFGALLTIALVGLLPTFMFYLDLNAFEKQQLKHILLPRLPLMAILTAVGLIVPVLFFGRFYSRHLNSLERVNHRLRETIESDGEAIELDEDLSPEEHTLLSNSNTLMATVQQRREALDQERTLSSSSRHREKIRLTTLLDQLTKGVLVCNLEGHILLANSRARTLLGSTQEENARGESIFALLDAELIAHALTIVRERLEVGTQAPRTRLSAITRSGNLVRLQLAAAVDNAVEGHGAVEGFVLTVEDIETQHSHNRERDKLLHGLTRETRNLLTRLRTGLDSLQRDPTANKQQVSLLTALGRDTVRHSDHLERLSFQSADQLSHAWPLEPILASDLFSAVQQQLQRSHHLQFPYSSEAPTNLWLEADSFSLAQGFANCAAALHTEWEIDGISLRTDVNKEHQLLLIIIDWTSGELRQEDFRALATSTRQRVAVGGRALVELIERHGGRAWLTEQQQERQHICIALPLCEPPPGADLSLPASEFDFSESADSTAKIPTATQLQHQYFTVIAVGAERNSAADMAKGESTLVALLLAGGKPVTLAQKKLQHATLVEHDDSPSTEALSEFSRNGCFVTHDATQLLSQLGSADKQVITQAGLLDTVDIAQLLFPTENSLSLYHLSTRLGLQTEVNDTADQVKLLAKVFNRLLTRLQTHGIHSKEQLQQALINKTALGH